MVRRSRQFRKYLSPARIKDMLLIKARPAIFAIGGLQFLSPYLVKIGSARFRRWIMDNFLPYPRIQHLKDLIDSMDAQARDLLSKKRLALKEGNEALLQQVGEGKDIMSVLRSSCSLPL